MKPGHYVLVCPSHGRGSEDHSKWVYSALSISEDNTASLKVNIAASSDAIEPNNDGEYSYQGSLKLARNHIFLSLYDNEQQEAINISFVRPLHEKERFIGIMTALSPSGHQPVAFKCACIGRSILPKLNCQTLSNCSVITTETGMIIYWCLRIRILTCSILTGSSPTDPDSKKVPAATHQRRPNSCFVPIFSYAASPALYTA